MNPEVRKEWKEMQNVWDSTNPLGPTVDEALAFVVERSERFDRESRRRNIREWIGGAVGVALAAKLLTMTESAVETAFGISMAACVIGVCLHLWFRGRSGATVDPALSLPRYRSSLEEKYRRQARVLSQVKYWFLIPLLATGSVTAWTFLNGSPAEKDWFYFPLIVVGSLLAYWANSVGEKKVREEWEKVSKALDRSEPC